MKKNYIIIANGTFLVKEIIQEAIRDKTIVALDGAANKLKLLGIKPDIILGDFDSIENAHEWGIHATFEEMLDYTIPYLGLDGVIIVPRKNQDLPDLIKGIQYCDEHGAQHITVICALGGRSDLHEAALRALSSEYRKGRPVVLHSDRDSMQFASNETVYVNGSIGDNCAVLAYPDGLLTTTGLKYSVEDHTLAVGKRDSISNSLTQPQAIVKIEGDALVIMPPQLQAQREFMQKSERERLKLLLRDME